MAGENKGGAAADTGNSGNSGQTENNLLTPDAQMANFQGFSAKDGVIQPPAPAPKTGKEAAKTPASQGKADAEDDDESDDSAGAGADDDDAQGAVEGQKHKSAQERINKAVRAQRKAERETSALRADNADLRSRLTQLEARVNGGNQQQTQQPTQQQPTGGDKEPNPADYKGGEFDPRYLADVAKHAARTEAKTQAAASQEATTKAQQEAAQQEFQTKRAAFADKGNEQFDDFEEVAFDDDVKISAVVGSLALDSDHGPAIIYALAQDSKEQKRVSAMTPARQAAWFGQREAELERSSKTQDAGGEGGEEEDDTSQQQPPQKVSKAPPPPSNTNKGRGGNRVSADTTDFAAFERMASAQR